jgi:hypothetical protein
MTCPFRTILNTERLAMIGKQCTHYLTLFVRIGDKMKNKPYNTAGTVPNSKRKMVKRSKIYTPTINSWVNNLILKKMHCSDLKMLLKNCHLCLFVPLD